MGVCVSYIQAYGKKEGEVCLCHLDAVLDGVWKVFQRADGDGPVSYTHLTLPTT